MGEAVPIGMSTFSEDSVTFAPPYLCSQKRFVRSDFQYICFGEGLPHAGNRPQGNRGDFYLDGPQGTIRVETTA